MNIAETIDMENDIMRRQLDGLDAVSILDALVANLERRFADTKAMEEVEHLRLRMKIALANLKEPE